MAQTKPEYDWPELAGEFEKWSLTNPKGSLKAWCDETGVPYRRCNATDAFRAARKRIQEAREARRAAFDDEVKNTMEQSGKKEAERLTEMIEAIDKAILEGLTTDRLPLQVDTTRDLLNAVQARKHLAEMRQGGGALDEDGRRPLAGFVIHTITPETGVRTSTILTEDGPQSTEQPMTEEDWEHHRGEDA